MLALEDLPLRAQEGAEVPEGVAAHAHAALRGFDAESSCYSAALPDGSQVVLVLTLPDPHPDPSPSPTLAPLLTLALTRT